MIKEEHPKARLIDVLSWGDVRRDIEQSLRGFAHWIATKTEIQHCLVTHVTDEAAIEEPGGVAAFALPDASPAECHDTAIYIAAGFADVLEAEHEHTREQAILGVVASFAHEIAHYEQWRDGRPVDEESAEKRAEELAIAYWRERKDLIDNPRRKLAGADAAN